MKEIKSITIGEFEYICGQYDPETALEVLRVASKTLGQPLVEFLVNHRPEDKPLAETDVAGLVSKVNIVAPLMNLKKGELWDFVLMCCSQVEATGNGRKVSLGDRDSAKDHFRGRTMEMFKVVKFSLEVNFKDFLLALAEYTGVTTQDSAPQ